MSSKKAILFDVFLSHNRAQKEWTRMLARRLRNDGFKVWFDEWELPRHAGSNFVDLLADAIEESKKVVLVWSPEFFANEWPEFEASLIQHLDPVGRKGRVIPLLHTPCEIPSKWGFRQRLSFIDCPHASPAFEFAYQQLVHNLDSSRPFEPDLQRFRPGELQFEQNVLSLGKRWRAIAWFSGIAVVIWMAFCVAAIKNPTVPGYVHALYRFILAETCGLGIPEVMLFAFAASGLLKLRPWGRRTAIIAALFGIAVPWGWRTFRMLLGKDAKAMYADVVDRSLQARHSR